MTRTATQTMNTRVFPTTMMDLDEIVDFQMRANGNRYPDSARSELTECFRARLEVTGPGLGWLARTTAGEPVAMALGCWTDLTADTIGDLTDNSASDTHRIHSPTGRNLYVLNLAVDPATAQVTRSPLTVGRRLLTMLYHTALQQGCRGGLGHSRIPSIRESMASAHHLSPFLRLWALSLRTGRPVDYSALADDEIDQMDQFASELAGISSKEGRMDPTVRYYGMLGGSQPVRVIRGASPGDIDSLGYAVLQAGEPARARALVSMRLA